MTGKLFALFCSMSLLLIGCSVEGPLDKQLAEQKIQQENEEPEEKQIEEKEEPKIENVKTTITLDEFNKIFELDPEETQYYDGKFELKDGSIVKADYLSYGENDFFYYASAIFYDGVLANIQLETEATVEEIEEILTINFNEDTIIEEFKFGSGYEITFNEWFHESNIIIYPNEWD